ncbi:MAG: hypothetical protein ACO1SV_02045 [Fimbriimonas sp.]
MERTELLNAFNDLQARVERNLDLQLDTKRQTLAKRAQRSPIGDLVVASVTAILVGNFAADHFAALVAAPIAALPAVTVFALAILYINLSIRQLIAISELDYAGPILEAQDRLARLRKLRIQSVRGAFIGALPLWVVFPVLLLQMVAGPRILFAIPQPWFWANVLFGLAMIPAVDWAMRRSRYARSLQDVFAGKEIVEAEAFLQDVANFRKD